MVSKMPIWLVVWNIFFHILGILIPTVQLTNIFQRGLKILWHTFFTQRSSHWIRPDRSDGDSRGIWKCEDRCGWPRSVVRSPQWTNKRSPGRAKGEKNASTRLRISSCLFQSAKAYLALWPTASSIASLWRRPLTEASSSQKKWQTTR